MKSRRTFIKLSLSGAIVTTAGALGMLEIYKRKNHITDIIKYPDKMLREISEPVDVVDKSIQIFCNKMIATLKYNTIKGLFGFSIPRGLSAPQVGINKRIIACGINGYMEVLINPQIVKKKGKYISFEECLSLPDYDGSNIQRYGSVKVKYTDLNNEEKILSVYDRYAALIQHEIDHLNGHLYIDHMIA